MSVCSSRTDKEEMAGERKLNWCRQSRLWSLLVVACFVCNAVSGYADGGGRLWKNNGGTYTIWIGGIYEVRGSQTLCHVFAGGQRVATFEPITPACALLYHDPFIAPVYEFFTAATTWPLQDGRAPLTATLIPLLGFLGLSVGSRRRTTRRRGRSQSTSVMLSAAKPLCRSLGSDLTTDEPSAALQRRYSRIQLRSYNSWQKLLLVFLTVAITVTTTHTNVYAATCAPVFWYYHGDHLGSSNIMTDRSGNLVDHYEYFAFGKTKYDDTTCSFNVSNRYTGQILDEDTGLYYYNARYYDPELGRFVQPDSIVPSPGDPQPLNRYSYVNNNPLKYIDPSGHDFGLTAVIIGVVVGAAVGAAAAAAQGGNVGLGALTGAIGGLFGGLGAWAGAAVGAAATGTAVGTGTGSLVGAVVGGAVGGAAGGAINATITGGNIGLGAATGAISGAASGWLASIGDLPIDAASRDQYLSYFLESTAIGYGSGFANTLVQGGSFREWSK